MDRNRSRNKYSKIMLLFYPPTTYSQSNNYIPTDLDHPRSELPWSSFQCSPEHPAPHSLAGAPVICRLMLLSIFGRAGVTQLWMYSRYSQGAL